jgi:hypothetical protein
MVPRYASMAPTLVRAPFHRAGWVCEEKVDGWKIIAYKDGQAFARRRSCPRTVVHL